MVELELYPDEDTPPFLKSGKEFDMLKDAAFVRSLDRKTVKEAIGFVANLQTAGWPNEENGAIQLSGSVRQHWISHFGKGIDPVREAQKITYQDDAQSEFWWTTSARLFFITILMFGVGLCFLGRVDEQRQEALKILGFICLGFYLVLDLGMSFKSVNLFSKKDPDAILHVVSFRYWLLETLDDLEPQLKNLKYQGDGRYFASTEQLKIAAEQRLVELAADKLIAEMMSNAFPSDLKLGMEKGQAESTWKEKYGKHSIRSKITEKSTVAFFDAARELPRVKEVKAKLEPASTPPTT